MTRADRRRDLLRGVAAGVAVVLLATCGGEDDASVPVTEQERVVVIPPAPSALVPEREVQPAPAIALPSGVPTRVVIETIDVDAELVRLGLQPDGSMEVPDFGWAGWYAEGPPPGHPGPAVIAAHVDSRAGPDVFFRLRDLAPGDEVEVHYDTGDAVVFVVESSERVPKDDLPGDRIWPVTADRRLTLITCGGEFDRNVRHYLDNVIVYTRPAEP